MFRFKFIYKLVRPNDLMNTHNKTPVLKLARGGILIGYQCAYQLDIYATRSRTKNAGIIDLPPAVTFNSVTVLRRVRQPPMVSPWKQNIFREVLTSCGIIV